MLKNRRERKLSLRNVFLDDVQERSNWISSAFQLGVITTLAMIYYQGVVFFPTFDGGRRSHVDVAKKNENTRLRVERKLLNKFVCIQLSD
jgi:hypothetical protein